MKKTTGKSLEKGQSLVELAFSLVLIIIILAGVVDVGRMMYEYLAMRDAAQEGAGYGAIYPSSCNKIIARVWDNLPPDFSTVNGDTVAVMINGKDCAAAYTADLAQPKPVNGCVGKDLSVILDHRFEMSMPFFSGVQVPMHVEIRDRIVRPKCN